jgi:hypothetical protein
MSASFLKLLFIKATKLTVNPLVLGIRLKRVGNQIIVLLPPSYISYGLLVLVLLEISAVKDSDVHVK